MHKREFICLVLCLKDTGNSLEDIIKMACTPSVPVWEKASTTKHGTINTYVCYAITNATFPDLGLKDVI